MGVVGPAARSAHKLVCTASGGPPCRALLVQHCANFTGSTISGRIIADGFRKAGWQVDVAFGFAGPFAEKYAELGCGVHVVPHKSWLRGGNCLQSARRIGREFLNARDFVRLLKHLQPDVVYVNSMVSLAAAVAARRLKIPCVWHLRELFDDVGGEMRVPAFGGRPLVRTLLKRYSKRRVAISRAVAENILGAASAPALEVVPNAVSPEYFELADDQTTCRRALNLPLDGPIVGVPGTLRPMKGHPFFFEAAGKLMQSVPNCRFAITGTGDPEYTAELHKQIQSLGLTERTFFLGTVTQMPRFYRACDLVCIPSVAEPFGRTVIEAFATGTPVAATAVGGMRETIENGRTGLLVEYGDVAGLSVALADLSTDRALRMCLGGAARAVAVAQYSEDVHQQRICRIVESVVGARGEKSPARAATSSRTGLIAS